MSGVRWYNEYVHGSAAWLSARAIGDRWWAHDGFQHAVRRTTDLEVR
jgi:hypothetical protein